MYLITPSLLNSWKYCVDNGTVEDFLQILNRIPTEKNEAMMKGDEFEKWAIENIDEIKNGVYQYAASKEYGEYLLYGRIDVLKAGIIYDLKYTGNYEVGKYYGNFQTSIYLELIPESLKMVYIIGNGTDSLFREEYTRLDCEPIDLTLKQFKGWLKDTGNYQTFTDKWKARD